jgi:1,2-diacylglycerol 3-alpha-glucosyltransferase
VNITLLEFVKDIMGVKEGKIAILLSRILKYGATGREAEYQSDELSRSGYSVWIYTFETDITHTRVKIKMIRPSFPHFPVNETYRALFFLDVATLIKLVQDLRNFDLLIIHHGNLTILGFLVKKLYGTKVVFWNHHVENVAFSTRNWDKLYTIIFSPINWRLIRCFDRVVSVSEFSRRELKSRWNIDSVVVYNKVDLNKFKAGLDGTIIRKKYGLGNCPLILFVGKIVPSKNIHTLIDIFRRIRREIPEARLIIIGKRLDKDYFKKIVEMGVEGVFFEENVSDEELPLYYAACDVYATCSLLEGFNLPVVEAQACGKPVVAFDIGPHREVVKRGFLVKPGDVECFKRRIIELLKKNYSIVRKYENPSFSET